jgi:hypothetical protein
MMPALDVRGEILARIQPLLQDRSLPATDGTLLVGGGALTSMKLVELCLSLEDLARQLGFEFDWTSEAAMSKARSMFRTAGSLADEFIAQMDARA